MSFFEIFDLVKILDSANLVDCMDLTLYGIVWLMLVYGVSGGSVIGTIH